MPPRRSRRGAAASGRRAGAALCFLGYSIVVGRGGAVLTAAEQALDRAATLAERGFVSRRELEARTAGRDAADRMAGN